MTDLSDRTIFLRCDYDEPDPATYRGVLVDLGNDNAYRFNTGNFDRDYAEAEIFAKGVADRRRFSLAYTSSLDNFHFDRFDQTDGDDLPQLFYAYSGLAGHQHNGRPVIFDWFVAGRPQPLPLPYEKLIRNYDRLDEHGRQYAEHYLKEAFTADEIEQLREYLADESLTVWRVKLPVKPSESFPFGGIPVGGPTNFHILSNTEGYPLPFAVWGYYDLRRCDNEPGDGRQTDNDTEIRRRIYPLLEDLEYLRDSLEAAGELDDLALLRLGRLGQFLADHLPKWDDGPGDGDQADPLSLFD